jgi:oligopeptide transport system ATP-binding protein
LYTIKGHPVSLSEKVIGDPFAKRNEYALEIDFLYEAPMFEVSSTHFAKTWLLAKNAPKVTAPMPIQTLKKMIKGGKNG